MNAPLHHPATTAPRTKYVHDALTGHVIASRTVALTDPFNGSWIFEACASYFERPRDDFESIETDEHDDGIALDGQLIAFVEVN